MFSAFVGGRCLPILPAARPVFIFRQVTPMSRAGLGLSVLATLVWGLAVVHAQADETPPDAADVEFFEQKIRPLLVTALLRVPLRIRGKRRKGKRGTRRRESRGGCIIDSRAGILAGGDSGPAVVSGKPAESLSDRGDQLLAGQAQMPPRGKLPQNEIDLLTEWVRRGAPFPGERNKARGAAGENEKGDRFRSGKKVLVVSAGA